MDSWKRKGRKKILSPERTISESCET